ncbi:CBS and ACT domain-containing protein [Alkalicoccus daliensis]|uniref:Acetoin utilization protein AcuB n=1 Tax=Alkalicoccus daliensis TaxID=745820 RepID=A0A1H0C9K8_9BACI|nr:CBS and ACT domain-containing protein [Alkalicoccus daliensis]SDN54523.1 acetoin utilization protein AcuB [Alkalicoccus daliensis]
MRVEEVMQKNIISVSPATSLTEARQIMKEKSVRHLPVLHPETKELEGIVSDRDLQKTEMNSMKDIMITSVHTAFPGDFVEEAAYMMLENRIHCLPVVDWHEKVIGMLTDTDLLTTLVKLTGADRPSSRVEVEVPDESGQLADLMMVAKETKQNIQSIFAIPAEEERMRIVMRLQTINPHIFVQALKVKRYDIVWPEEPEMES